MDNPGPRPYTARMLETFHRRPLPPALIALSSDEGRRVFAEALAAGTMEGYFAIAEHFQTQAEPAYCGLTRELLDPALVAHLDALKTELGASSTGALAATIAAGLELDPALAALLVLAAPARVIDAAGAMAGPWRALREPLSPALTEQLAQLDAQLAEVITAGSCCVR